MNLFEYENICPEISQSCKLKQKKVSLLMQKFEK